MKLYFTIILRILLYVSLAVMVYDIVRVEQKFELLGRGYIEEFSLNIGNHQVGVVFIVTTIILAIMNVIQLFVMQKKKQSQVEDYILPEYDSTDERSVEITGKAVRIAFVFILVYSLFVLGSYIYVPNYFLDYVWFPMFTTASIPVVGLIVYLISFKVLYTR